MLYHTLSCFVTHLKGAREVRSDGAGVKLDHCDVLVGALPLNRQRLGQLVLGSLAGTI